LVRTRTNGREAIMPDRLLYIVYFAALVAVFYIVIQIMLPG
jgi:hypothetical protein